MRRKFGWLGTLTALIILAGCNPQDARNLSEDTRKMAVSAEESLKNATLAAKVNAVLSVWKGVDMSGWHVEAQGDTVTLKGEVRNAAERKRIENVVKQIRGVEKCDNQLTVKPP